MDSSKWTNWTPDAEGSGFRVQGSGFRSSSVDHQLSVRGRRGAVLLVAIVCIAVASVIFLSLLRLSVAERRRVETEAWQVQAAWLAESGIERAAARLAADPEYQGETWALPADLLGGRYDAVVKIRVETIPDDEPRRLVHVEADYPDDPQNRARRSKQVVMEVERQ